MKANESDGDELRPEYDFRNLKGVVRGKHAQKVANSGGEVMVDSVVRSDPEVLSGKPVFVGTRVPVRNLLEYLAAGDPLSVFLEDFPSVTGEQATAVLREVIQLRNR